MLVGEDEDPLRIPEIPFSGVSNAAASSVVLVPSCTGGTASDIVKPSLEHLPRTLVWKIQLQLWELPPTNSSSNEFSSVDSNSESLTVESISNYNQSRWERQKEYIQTIRANHMWKNSPLELIQHLSIKEEEEEDADKSTCTTHTCISKKGKEVDPLSLLIVDAQENDVSGWNEFYNNREMIDLIYKDLNRLSPRLIFPNEEVVEESPLNHSQQQQQKYLREERLRLLADILFCYAKEHPQFGYRQGMHEVLAHILVALDLEKHLLPEQSPFLFENSYLLFQGWMHQGIQNAYESSSTMGQHIIQLIQSANKELYQLLTSLQQAMGAPPELYCSKWLRLLFSREVSSVHQVLHLWDTFLSIFYNPIPYVWPSAATSSTMVPSPPYPSQGNIPLTFVDIMECAACAMILLQRKVLMSMLPTTNSSPTADTSTTSKDMAAYHDCLHLLMNYPCIQDITDWKRMIQRVVQYIVQSRLGIFKTKAKKDSSTNTLTRPNFQENPTSNPTHSHNSHTFARKNETADTSHLPNTSSTTAAFSESIHAVTDPLLSRVGTFLEGVKSSAQQVIATVDDSLKVTPPHGTSSGLREDFWARRMVTTRNNTALQQERHDEGRGGKDVKELQRERVRKLTGNMKRDIDILKKYIASTATYGSNNQCNVPQDVWNALEGLEQSQKALALQYN